MAKKKTRKKTLKDFNILGVKYKAEYGETPVPFIGLCDKGEKQIIIEKDIDERHHMKTIVHEVTHGLLHESGIDCVITPEVEELICLTNERLCELFKVELK